MSAPRVRVIGAGLAGCEAAWQIARQGISVTLYEMKPHHMSPAHHSEDFGELVCSNSLRSMQLINGVGLLKAELSSMGSLIMEAAYATQVPAGSALAVDREAFSRYITEKIESHPNIEVVRQELHTPLSDEITVCATGPLTDGKMAEAIAALLPSQELHFYDAVAPIVAFAGVNMERAYFASRYGKGDPTDYLNCPMTKEEYDAFYEALCSAEEAKLHDFDQPDGKITVFEGCMPVEVMARRGYDTLRFGPMKPVGLPKPDGTEAYAVVQLRRENKEGTMYNLVGFQTHLTFGEQKRVFRMIPGLEEAEFLRFGVMHRNTYLQSPGFLQDTYATIPYPTLYFAGQMTGVEGYIESAASGFVAGLNAARQAQNLPPIVFPKESMIGAMAHYVSCGTQTKFQPMNANFGLLPPLAQKVKGPKTVRYEAMSKRALSTLLDYCQSMDLPCDLPETKSETEA